VQSDARRREDARDSAPAGPGCAGFVVVVTPRSPVGQALRHSRPRDTFEIIVHGRDREWTVVDLMLEQEPDEWPEHASNCAHQAGRRTARRRWTGFRNGTPTQCGENDQILKSF